MRALFLSIAEEVLHAVQAGPVWRRAAGKAQKRWQLRRQRVEHPRERQGAIQASEGSLASCHSTEQRRKRERRLLHRGTVDPRGFYPGEARFCSLSARWARELRHRACSRRTGLIRLHARTRARPECTECTFFRRQPLFYNCITVFDASRRRVAPLIVLHVLARAARKFVLYLVWSPHQINGSFRCVHGHRERSKRCAGRFYQ